ncbi:class I SAM-dependent methyltransferase [candidate division WOR-3 bacterium]|nr:class I SAM-dependent methyltransferase [candidate division WOR-3 bacterium]
MREEEFWDNLAQTLTEISFEPGVYEKTGISALGNINDKLILDCGIGTGKSSYLLSKRGANVVGFDISLSMLKLAKTKIKGVSPAPKWCRVNFLKMSSDRIGFKKEKFDIVFGAYFLHHTRIKDSILEIKRVLKKGGKGVFVETFGVNPLLNFCRSHIAGKFGIPKYGSPEEHPLTGKDLIDIKSHFKTVKILVPDVLFMKLLARQVFHFKSRLINFLCSFFDRWIYKGFPGLRKYSYAQVIIVENEVQNSTHPLRQSFSEARIHTDEKDKHRM